MSEEEFLELIKAQAKQDRTLPRLNFDSVDPIPYLFVDIQTRKPRAAAALYASVDSTDSGGNVKPHCVVLSCFVLPGQSPEYYIHCGDAFLEGKKSAAEVREQLTAAVPSFDSAALATLMRAHGAVVPSSGCNFWRKWNSPEKELCKHTAHFLSQLKDPQGILEDLAEAACVFTGQQAASSGAPTAAPKTLAFADLAFKAHALLEGDRGIGKTTEAMAYVHDHDCAFFTLQGHAGVEAMDILGHTTLMPGAERTAVWVDGPLSAAFRSASRGKKTVLLIDEILRIPESQQTVLLGALSPFRGQYRLNTGRVLKLDEDGVAVTEVLTCKCENLWVVATTNVGIEYAVSKMDPALRERFIPIYREGGEEAVETHLRVACAKFGMECSGIVSKLVALYKILVKSKKDQLLHDEPTSRTLCRAVELSDTPAAIPAALRAQVGLWVGRDPYGRFIPDQVRLVEAAINQVFR